MEKSHKLFESLFNANSTTPISQTEALFHSMFSDFIAPQVLSTEIEHLNADFSENEIYKNLKALHLKGPSSPGPDGITYAAWFHSWKHSKRHIISFINQSHFTRNHTNLHSTVFNSLIKLIPKKNFDPKNPNPEHLRPISLTNTIFRLYNFSLTKRSMEIFNRIISPCQQAFLPKRDIHLHIQTAKIIANYVREHPQSPSSILLIDIKKAFDSISHNFIITVLKRFNFPETFINAVVYQTKTGYTQLLNGRFIFRPRIRICNGTRQGLPLSPIIFNLCLEPLLNKINSSVKGIIYNPLNAPRSLSGFHHLTHQPKLQAFADDIITFNKDINDIIKTIQIFADFKTISGLQLNHNKSKIYSNPNALNLFNSSSLSNIEVTSITENPTYLGIPLVSINWEEKLDTLIKRLRRICFMDLPVHLIVLGINTYIFSTIYFMDQHDPIPTKILIPFINKVKLIVKESIWPKIPNKNYWYIPRKQGGFGMMDLETQLKGRRSFFILYALDPLQSGAKHPHLYKLLRIQLQGQILYTSYLNTIINNVHTTTIKDINQHQHCPISIPSTYKFRQYVSSAQRFVPWYYLVTNFSNNIQTPATSCISLQSSKVTVRYSELYREKNRQRLFDERNQIEARFLQQNIIPPPLGPYPPPSHLTFSDDIIKDIAISPPQTYAPLQQYLAAWKAVVLPIIIPVQEAEINEESIYNIMEKPETIQTFKPILKTKLIPLFGKPNDNEITSTLDYHVLNHLSSKLHYTRNYLHDTTLTWAKSYQLEEKDWKRFFKHINKQVFTNSSEYYYLYALNTGLLNNTFFRSCPCNLSFHGSPIRHVINECHLTRYIFQYYNYQSSHQLYQNLIYDPRLVICPSNMIT
ncbi:RNA-directed DNA polymerase, partial [Enterobacter mori]